MLLIQYKYGELTWYNAYIFYVYIYIAHTNLYIGNTLYMREMYIIEAIVRYTYCYFHMKNKNCIIFSN